MAPVFVASVRKFLLSIKIFEMIVFPTEKCLANFRHPISGWSMHGQPCLASKNFRKNNIHIQDQKLNGSVLKHGKLAYFQNVVNLNLTQA